MLFFLYHVLNTLYSHPAQRRLGSVIWPSVHNQHGVRPVGTSYFKHPWRPEIAASCIHMWLESISASCIHMWWLKRVPASCIRMWIESALKTRSRLTVQVGEGIVKPL